MGLGVRGARAALLLGALQVLALAGAAQPPESPNTEIPVPLHNSSGNLSDVAETTAILNRETLHEPRVL
ncbi:hypothetical protein GW7_17212 [Heterocephalus glaber]|uniref:Uncharacterized protein n=1 Tax=Heterocephalus glaber TaxID=10181 RepID=G5BT97_HETGA|nr:hypothetical protein GW7_17212 [Heterocephalus glaber]